MKISKLIGTLGLVGLFAVWTGAAHAQRGEYGAAPLTQLTDYGPKPAILGQPAYLVGRGFGSDPRRFRLEWGSYERLGVVLGTLGPMQITRWTDTRIDFRLPAEITAAGTYWIHLRPVRTAAPSGTGVLSTDNWLGGVTLEVALPRPTISGYARADICPTEPLSIRGSNFTRIRNAFLVAIVTRPDTPGARDNGLVLNTEVVRSWSDNRIDIQLPTNIRARFSPGYHYRVDLMTHAADGRSLRTMARGPDAQFRRDCGTAGQARVGGDYLQPRLPVARTELTFDFAPARSPVKLGSDILFGGTFVVSDAELLRQIRAQPLVVEWRIVKRGTAIAVLQGSVKVRGPRTPLLARTRPAEIGEYELVFNMPALPRGLELSARHAERNRIEVFSLAPVQINKPLPRQQRNTRLPAPQLIR
ncbi:MAG: hypothetical protein DWQ09_14025 [Proteobacteria bacterium]|nr:MAG: hypothetical protein DWQ09_14025 [Pseudomonadota bacterium]QKK10381.1 MAG: hypothetical protein HND59_00900 [Pseudomonadota bacterium]